MRQTENKPGVGADLDQGSRIRDWSPISKRSRRLSGSDLDMNPTAPDLQGVGGRESKLSGGGGWEGEDTDERRSLAGGGRGGIVDPRNWDRRMDHGGQGSSEGGGAAEFRSINQNWPNPPFGGPQGGARFGNEVPRGAQMASFGNQGPRSGGGMGGEWQGGRSFDGHHDGGEDDQINPRFAERSQSGSDGQRGSRW